MNEIQKPRSQGRERNLGVDLLRCAAMWMIACLHVLNQGGVKNASTPETWDWLLPLLVLAYCGVSIYALISGYVTVCGRFRPARAAELWLQVLFWNLVIAAVGELLKPHVMDGLWIRYCFPLTQKCYWYFTAYVGVCVFSPLINRGILQLNPKQCKALLWTVLALFSLGTFLGYLNQGDPWGIGAGYNVLWLLCLYVVGACIRRSGFGSRIALWKLLLIVALCIAATTLLRRAGTSETDPESLLKKVSSQLLYYHTPMITGVAVCLLLVFSRLRLRGFWAKFAAFFAPLSFGVYVIHVHHVVWDWLKFRFSALGKLSPPLALVSVIGAAVGLFLVCALLDWLRARLFRLLRLRKGLDRLEAKLLGRLQEPDPKNP